MVDEQNPIVPRVPETPQPLGEPEEYPVVPVDDGSVVEPETLEDIADIKESWLYAMLSYISVLVFVPLLTRKDDPFVNYHIRQGLVILGGTIISLIVTVWFPRFGSMLFLLFLLVSVVGIVTTLQGRQWRIPIVGHIAERFKI
jgi:uncharacterized membrane protein